MGGGLFEGWSGSWTDLPFHRGGARSWRSSVVVTIFVYLVVIVAVAASIVAVELALGDHGRPGYPPELLKSEEDAVWHVVTAFLIVLPVRNRTLLWAYPFCALGLDIDHVFGAVLPTVTGRTAHDVFLLALLGVVFLALQGRSAVLLTTTAMLEHLAVDGGAFPLFGPISTTTYGFPTTLAFALLAVAAIGILVAARPLRSVLQWRTAVALLVVWTIVAIAIVVVPMHFSFLEN